MNAEDAEFLCDDEAIMAIETRRNIPTKVKKVVEYLIPRLKKNFIVQKSDSLSTASVYLKLDYGVAGSIRISNHQGKRQYHFSFAVDTTAKHNQFYVDNKGIKRRVYTSRKEDLDLLILHANNYKKNRLIMYGEARYKIYMKKNLEAGMQLPQHTFWHKARTI